MASYPCMAVSQTYPHPAHQIFGSKLHEQQSAMNNNLQSLTQEKSGMFMEVVEASLRVTRREQFFSWLQGSFHYLFPHEVMFCGMSASNNEDVHFESFSSRCYAANYTKAVTSPHDGVVWQAMTLWQQARRPVLLGEGLLAGDYGSYVVPVASTDVNLEVAGLHNIAAHGMMGQNGNVSSFFCFCSAPQPLGMAHAHLLELLTPYLHSALVRVTGQRSGVQFGKITVREREVLQWLRSGKTNWEIAQILDISPNTVKNHVQNILRKLNVENRSHAAAKASGAWLTKSQNSLSE